MQQTILNICICLRKRSLLRGLGVSVIGWLYIHSSYLCLPFIYTSVFQTSTSFHYVPLCCAPHQSTMICTYFRKRSTVLSYRRLAGGVRNPLTVCQNLVFGGPGTSPERPAMEIDPRNRLYYQSIHIHQCRNGYVTYPSKRNRIVNILGYNGV